MPGGDKTGPMGMGPQTGRGMGFCAGYSAPGYMNPSPGFGRMGLPRGWAGAGYGRGRGMGRGFRMGGGYPAYGPATREIKPEDEANYLKNEAQALQEQLDVIQQRLTQLESGQNK